MEPGVFRDVPPCDPENTRTKPPPVPDFPKADHHEHKSINDLSSFFRYPVPKREPECHLREVSSPSGRILRSHRPAVPPYALRHQPNRPASSGPVRHRDVRI